MTNKKHRKARPAERSKEDGSMAAAMDPSLAHQSSIPLLREAYMEAMIRPEYWWIQDECIETIGKTLSERNYVVRSG
eukprot:8982984-Pyramimonas_sp.AAC.1